MADASIPLSVRPPQITPPAEMAGQILGLRNLQNRGQLEQEQIQSAQMANQEAKLQLQDQTTMRQVLQDPEISGPTGINWDKAIQKMSGQVSPRTLFSLQQTMLGTQEKRAQIARAQAETTKTQGEIQKQQQEHFGNIALGVQGQNYDPVAYEAMLTESEHMNQGNPQALQHIAQLREAAQKDPTTIKAVVDQMVNASEAGRKAKETASTTAKNFAETDKITHARAIEDLGGVSDVQSYAQWQQKYPQEKAPANYDPDWTAKQVRSTVPAKDLPEFDLKTAQVKAMRNSTPESRAQMVDSVIDPTKGAFYASENSRVKGLVEDAVKAGLDPKDIISEIRAGADRAGRMESGIAQAKATAPIKIYTAAQTEAAKTAQGMTTPGGAEAQNLHGQEYIDSLPSGLAGKVKAIVEGRSSPFTGRAGATGVGGQIMNAVYQADPDFSEQRAQIRKAFTTGSDAKNIGALNTATAHLDQLGDAIEALKNGSFRPGNQAYNYFANLFGSAPPTNYAALTAAVSSEMASALKGNATDPEIATLKSNLSAAASPEQGRGAVNTNLHILAAKLNTYEERYRQQIPGDKVWSPVLPTAKAVFEKNGINPTAGASEIKGKSGEGAPPPLPATLSSSDVGKTFTAKDGKRLKVTAVNPANPKQFRSTEAQ